MVNTIKEISSKNTINILCIKLIAAAVLLLCTYLVTPYLPLHVGWENGLFEVAQCGLLVIGFIVAALCFTRAETVSVKMLWLIALPLWTLLFLRELSWGAVFMTPLEFSEITGPVFSSTQQLWYKPWISPIAAVTLAISISIFAYFGVYRKCRDLLKAGHFPIIEIILSAVFFSLSSMAEMHEVKIKLFAGGDSAQVFEEIVECYAYGCLLFAQFRIMMNIGK